MADIPLRSPVGDPPATTPASADLNALAIDQREAARLTGLSAKTLGRLADAGETVGRVKIGRRVLYHRATLSAWLSARAAGRARTTDLTPAH